MPTPKEKFAEKILFVLAEEPAGARARKTGRELMEAMENRAKKKEESKKLVKNGIRILLNLSSNLPSAVPKINKRFNQIAESRPVYSGETRFFRKTGFLDRLFKYSQKFVP